MEDKRSEYSKINIDAINCLATDIKEEISKLAENLHINNIDRALLSMFEVLKNTLPAASFLEITNPSISQEEGSKIFSGKYPQVSEFLELIQKMVFDCQTSIEKVAHTNEEIETAVIIAGGIATRLRPLTYGLPKPLLPINGKTLTEHVMDIVKKYGVSNITLGLGQGAEMVKGYFGQGEKFGVNINYTEEKVRLGTAGPLFLMRKPEKPFLMINGDNLFDLDINRMFSFFRENNAAGVIALTSVDDSMKGGAVKLDGNRITGFFEKLPKEEARKRIGEPPYWLNSGYYLLSPAVFDYLPKEKTYTMMENHIFPKMAEDGRLYGFKWNGQWHDSGTPERYKEIVEKWKG